MNKYIFQYIYHKPAPKAPVFLIRNARWAIF